jgi:Nucleotidyltransferase domain
VRRSEATRRLERLLRNAAGSGRYSSRIREIWVFGSYARGATEVGDIDLDVEYEHDRELNIEAVQALSYGRDPHAGFNRELRGAQRIFQLHYGQRDALAREFPGELVQLYAASESLDQTLARLHAIPEQAEAGRAPRDPVVAELEGLERHVPRPQRNEVSELVRQGALVVERVELTEARPANGRTARLVESRWGETNPKRRAALAAAAYLERQGIGPLRLRRPGACVLGDRENRVGVGLGGSGLADGIEFLAHGGSLWLEVVNPSRTAPLVALVLRPGASRKPVRAEVRPRRLR